MTAVIVFKWAKSPADVRVGADGTVDWKSAKMAASDDDSAAIAVARDVAGDAEIVGVTIGDGDDAWAAARGAARTIAVKDAGQSADAGLTARTLAAAIKTVSDANLVVIGDSLWGQAVPGALAGELGWSTLAGVSEASADGDAIVCVRRTTAGTETVRVAKPAVIAVAARRTEDKPPGMKDVLMARKKPMEKLSMSDLGVDASTSVTLRESSAPKAVSANIFDGSDPAAAAQSLVAALRTEGVL